MQYNIIQYVNAVQWTMTTIQHNIQCNTINNNYNKVQYYNGYNAQYNTMVNNACTILLTIPTLQYLNYNAKK